MKHSTRNGLLAGLSLVVALWVGMLLATCAQAAELPFKTVEWIDGHGRACTAVGEIEYIGQGCAWDMDSTAEENHQFCAGVDPWREEFTPTQIDCDWIEPQVSLGIDEVRATFPETVDCNDVFCMEGDFHKVCTETAMVCDSGWIIGP